MYCPHCGTRCSDTAKFCVNCGKPLTQETSRPVQPQNSYLSSYSPNPDSSGPQGGPPKNNSGIPLFAKILIPVLAVIAIVLIVILLTTGNKKPGKTPAAAENKTENSSSQASPQGTSDTASEDSEAVVPGTATVEITDEYGNATVMTVDALPRPSFLTGLRFLSTTVQASPSAETYTIASDLSNVINAADFYLHDEQKAQLLQNYFYIMARSGGHEFFSTYEMNRYQKRPNFVTTDSMMHVYHLYFSHLLKTTERNYLSASLGQLSAAMLAKSSAQLEALRGTEWEKAAIMNTAYFAVGASLLDQSVSIPSDVADIAQRELQLINEHSGIAESPLLNIEGTEPKKMDDYSQYIVRGYYEGDAQLEKYFRAMMWYGRMYFLQSEETTDRAALLITLCLDDETRPLWEAIYSVTSFFAGASDDSGYYEYRPIIDAVYGENIAVADLVGNDAAFAQYHALTATMEPPKINSVPVFDTGDDTDHVGENKSFRFMGQRFSLDAAIFQNLLYNKVKENSAGEKRMLPDALDIPAALGSDTALNILTSRGATGFKDYSENMTAIRSDILSVSDDLWNASLYSKWLDTLRPLLTVKNEGYPPFMQNDAWTRKNLQTFLGSYAELKHDTVLYSKQVMVEMGGDDYGEKDDRGYVEPEPELFGKLSDLTQATKDGLASYGLLNDEDSENLTILASLADQLRVIAEKELRNEMPTDDEFELIRSFGGQLEHFWREVYKHESDSEHFTSRDFPAAIVTDIATDPNGSCLEVATGQAGEIFVVVPVGGSLRIASGTVYSFYQFKHPISDRLTDSKWRVMMGAEMNESGGYNKPAYELEDWTRDFQLTWDDLQS